MSDPVETLYDQHASGLAAFLLNLTRSELETRDILQELFMKVVQRPGLLEGVRDMRGFLLRLAHNLAIDTIRRRARRDVYEEQAGESIDLFAPAADPDAQAFCEALSTALAHLPEEQRAVVHLKLWERRTFQEIAQVLDLPQDNVVSRYRYGIEKLRQRLRPIYREL